MSKNNKDFIEVDDVDAFDYETTKKNVDNLYGKYRNYTNKIEIITKRYKSPLSLDNLRIFSNKTSDPVGNKVEQMDRYKVFVDIIDGIFDLNKNDLSKDEMIVYRKCIIEKFTDEELSDYLSLGRIRCYYRKRS